MARIGTTNWSLVLRAGADDSAVAREALGELCTAYWYPVYAMVRRYGHGPANAEDLTQAYFARFLEKGWVKEVRPEHGRFRSFLLVSVRNFLHNERDRERAWAERVLARALDRLEEEMAEAEGRERVAQLKPHLTGDEPATAYRELAEAWGVGEPAVRVAVHRLRKRFGSLLRAEIAATVADPAEVGEELRHLLTTLGR